ncbi:type II secretion system protein E [Clostridia bacterium]|nr:type II secretion system protein E [Clostridia bacterium]GHV36817.1 type II secretion system protein E [Clostridia bacterium]
MSDINTTALKTLGYDAAKLMPLYDVLDRVQEYMSVRYSDIFSDPDAGLLKSYIQQYLIEQKLGAEGFTLSELVERLYWETAAYSFLTPFLDGSIPVEEINVNGYNCVKIRYPGGEQETYREHFRNATHSSDVLKRLLHRSGMIIDNAQPLTRGHLGKNIRVTVMSPPVTDEDVGVVASIRFVNPRKLKRENFIEYKTATAEMLDFIAFVIRHGVSVCVAGATNSGKTTLMSWAMSLLPDDLRVYTIENGVREFDLVKKENDIVTNDIIHTVTRASDDPAQNIDQEKLLEFALTMNPDVICVGEMKSSEAFAAQEAARTGHTVLTTIHANSCEATYRRMVTLCKTRYDMDDGTLYDLVTEAFPIVIFAKLHADGSRRITEITEMEIMQEQTRRLRVLYRFDTSREFRKMHDISKSLQRQLVANEVPVDELTRFLKNGLEVDL